MFSPPEITAPVLVTCYQDEVRLLLIDHINPSGQFFPGVVIAQMQVARHHNLICPRQRLRRLQLQRHTDLVLIMYIPIKEQTKDQDKDNQRGIAIVADDGLRYQTEQSSQIKDQEDDDQI